MISVLIIISTSWSIKEHMFVFECNIWSINMRWLEGCMFSKWCVKWLHHLPVSNQNWINSEALHKCVPRQRYFLGKSFSASKAYISEPQNTRLCSISPIIANNKCNYCIWETILLCLWFLSSFRLLMSGRLRSEQEQVRIYRKSGFCCNIYWWSLNACLDKMPVSSLTMKWGILTVMKLGVHVVDINLAISISTCNLFSLLGHSASKTWYLLGCDEHSSFSSSDCQFRNPGADFCCYHMWYCWNLVAMRADNEILKVLQLKPLPEMTTCQYQ